MKDMVIRPFAPEDRQLVVDFFAQMGGESRAFFNRSNGNFRCAMSFFDGDPGDRVFWMAESEGRMVGYLFLYGTAKRVPWLGIAISEACKGQGLGKKLMAHARAYALEQGKGGLLLTTHVANLRGQGLYEGSGYQRMGIHTSGEVLYLLNFDDGPAAQ